VAADGAQLVDPAFAFDLRGVTLFRPATEKFHGSYRWLEYAFSLRARHRGTWILGLHRPVAGRGERDLVGALDSSMIKKGVDEGLTLRAVTFPAAHLRVALQTM
jgi:hypothetical protein